jgi:hypothetical protein
MSAADEVARLEAETALAVSAAAVAQSAAAEAVADADALRHQVTREAAETIRERDEEIRHLREREACLTNEMTELRTEVDSLALGLMGLVSLANPNMEVPAASTSSSPETGPPNVAVVAPVAAKTPDQPVTPEPETENPAPPEKPKKRHRLL